MFFIPFQLYLLPVLSIHRKTEVRIRLSTVVFNSGQNVQPEALLLQRTMSHAASHLDPKLHSSTSSSSTTLHNMSTAPVSLPIEDAGMASPASDPEKALDPGRGPNTSATVSDDKIVSGQDWNGPDDPENPENWSIWLKVYHVAIIGLQCFVM